MTTSYHCKLRQENNEQFEMSVDDCRKRKGFQGLSLRETVETGGFNPYNITGGHNNHHSALSVTLFPQCITHMCIQPRRGERREREGEREGRGKGGKRERGEGREREGVREEREGRG